MKKILWLGSAMIVLVILACGNRKEMETYKLNEMKTTKALEILSTKKIYFGHQSVGYNIIDGIEMIEEELNGKKLNIIEVKGDDHLPDAWFAHSPVGQNRNPEAKCDDFKKYVESNSIKEADLVLLKFCYVDIYHYSDIDAVFSYYNATIDSLKKHLPGVGIVHLTVPLKANETGWKPTIKKVIGRPLDSELDNVKRHQFNEKMRQAFSDEMMMDLAAWESTYPDGSRELFDFEGKKIPQLIKAYTSDGGHLNRLGKKYIAEKFLQTLAEFAQSK